MTTIRNARVEEFERLMRFIERSFGLPKTFFQRVYPHLYQPTPEACAWAYVVEDHDEIVSHIGLYPIETVTAGVNVRIGGIGAVSTAPSARGKGYMTKLLYHVIEEMRRQGYPLSWLGGDRQRYSSFGWEIAGMTHTLTFTPRSFERANTSRMSIEEQLPWEALETIRKYQSVPSCHMVRPDLEHHIRKADLRVWVAEDGYAIAQGQDFDRLRFVELVSASGNEAGMLRAILEWTDIDRGFLQLSAWDQERLGRLMAHAAGWRPGSNEMYRINDLTQLLVTAKPVLSTRAVALKDLRVSIGIQEHDRTNVTDIIIHNGTIEIGPGQQTEQTIVLSPLSAARLFLGGPAIPELPNLPSGLQALVPIPVYVSPMDFV